MSKKEVRNYKNVRKFVENKVKNRKEVINRRGKRVVPRKLHMTEEEVNKFSVRFSEDTSHVSQDIKDKAGPRFFNAYRQAGIYYGCVQALYLLGCNEWHELRDVTAEIVKVMSDIFDKDNKSSWSKFNGKTARKRDGIEVRTAKDTRGRIKETFRVLQRRGGLNPYGEKLRQVGACIDIAIEASGTCRYRLRTGLCDEETIKAKWKPVLDTKAFTEAKKEAKRFKKAAETAAKTEIESTPSAEELKPVIRETPIEGNTESVE